MPPRAGFGHGREELQAGVDDRVLLILPADRRGRVVRLARVPAHLLVVAAVDDRRGDRRSQPGQVHGVRERVDARVEGPEGEGHEQTLLGDVHGGVRRPQDEAIHDPGAAIDEQGGGRPTERVPTDHPRVDVRVVVDDVPGRPGAQDREVERHGHDGHEVALFGDRPRGRRIGGRRDLAARVEHQTDPRRSRGRRVGQPTVLTLLERRGGCRRQGGRGLGQERLWLRPPQEPEHPDEQDDGDDHQRGPQQARQPWASSGLSTTVTTAMLAARRAPTPRTRELVAHFAGP